MAIELRVLSGARAGQTETFEQPRITFGRHPENDLRFDAQLDLNVSTRHGEIVRTDDGRYVIRDNNSTNGTFVNGERLGAGDGRELRDGDTIMFGAQGPQASVRVGPMVDHVSHEEPAADMWSFSPIEQAPIERGDDLLETYDPSAVPVSPLQPRGAGPVQPVPPAPPVPPVRQPDREPPLSAAPTMPRGRTTERVALAVAHQTRGLKITVAVSIVVLGALGFAGYWAGHSEARAADGKMRALTESYDSSSRQLQMRLASLNDTALIKQLEHQKDSLVGVARAATGSAAVAARRALERHQTAARAIGGMDLPAVHAANDDAVTLIRTNLGTGAGLEATGFSVAGRGLVVTNRHVVADGTTHASEIRVKFANTDAWRPAHLVRMPRDTSIDLALVQLDDAAKVPVVSGIAKTADLAVGAPIASLGFPDGSDLPMDGAKAKTTLTLGTVSKLTADLLQIDSYAAHGSSGSPVFDGHGHVVGVIFGGAPGSGGRIVYAVPANRIEELLRSGT